MRVLREAIILISSHPNHDNATWHGNSTLQFVKHCVDSFYTADQDTRIMKGWGTCPRSHSWDVTLCLLPWGPFLSPLHWSIPPWNKEYLFWQTCSTDSWQLQRIGTFFDVLGGTVSPGGKRPKILQQCCNVLGSLGKFNGTSNKATTS